jgi:hypothetical protein
MDDRDLSAGMGAVVVPEDHRCPQCGYPSGRSGSAVCPECGWTLTNGELEAERRRRAEVREWGGVTDGRWVRSGMRREIHRWLGAIALLAVGTTVWEPGLGTCTFALLIPGVLVTVAWSLGWVIGRLKPQGARDYTRMVWRRTLWRLHMPWLFAPLYLAAAILLGLVDVAVAGGGWLYWCLPPVAWVLWCAIVFASWRRLYRRTVVMCGPAPARAGASDALASVIGAGVMLVSCGLGLMVGFLIMGRVSVWLGVGLGPWKLVEIFALGGL